MEWLPIESAPREEIILLYSTSQGVVIGSWNKFAGMRISATEFTGGWTFTHDFGDGYDTPDLDDVTHWAPMPEPPS